MRLGDQSLDFVILFLQGVLQGWEQKVKVNNE